MGKNMSMTKVVMPEQEPNVRNKNFKEVALGYTKEMAMEEAGRGPNRPEMSALAEEAMYEWLPCKCADSRIY